jgi:putative ABC transport system substrate-binding protein
MALARRTAFAALLTSAALGWPALAAESTRTVAVTAIVEHPALDAARDGIREALKAGGYEEGRNLRFLYESAQGNPATAAQIARKLAGERPDVIVPISTPSAQAVVAATKDIPVVFTAVTDPVAAKLVADPARPGGNVTGMTDLSPIGKHLDLIQEVTPSVKTLGVVYNPGEANSVVLIDLLKREAPARNITIRDVAAPKSADVLPAAQSLVGNVDAVYVPTDNTVVTALEAIVKIGVQNKLPVYAGDTDSVPRGALAALGFNYADVGRQTGRIVLEVLGGRNPGEIPVQGVEITELHLNLGSAQAMGVTMPDAVVKRAKKVID